MKGDRLYTQWWVWLLVLAFLGYLMQSPAGREYISKKEQVAGKGIFKIVEGDTDPLSGFQQLQREMEFDKTINTFVTQRKELPDYIKQTKTRYNEYLVELAIVKEDKVFVFKQEVGPDKVESSKLIKTLTIPNSFLDFFTPEDRAKLTKIRAREEEIKKLKLQESEAKEKMKKPEQAPQLSKEERKVTVERSNVFKVPADQLWAIVVEVVSGLDWETEFINDTTRTIKFKTSYVYSNIFESGYYRIYHYPRKFEVENSYVDKRVKKLTNCPTGFFISYIFTKENLSIRVKQVGENSSKVEIDFDIKGFDRISGFRKGNSNGTFENQLLLRIKNRLKAGTYE